MYSLELAFVLAPLPVVTPLAATTDWWYLSLAALLVVVCSGSAALLSVNRFHDLGLSGWHTLLLVVPVLNLPGLLLLALLPGVPVANRWGTVPRLRRPAPLPGLSSFGFALLRYARIRWRLGLH